MEDNHFIQNALDVIDSRITERTMPQELAKECGYSAFHFNRMFSGVTGITLMAYVTRRKLQYALFDLSSGEKIIDIAFKYGFETHAGFTSRHKVPDVRFTHDIPLYWETINMDCAEPLTRLHNLFNKSRHSEVTVCFDIDPLGGEFTYLLGVGVDNPEDLSRIEPGMYKMKMAGGLYAKFTTPLVEESKHSQNVRDTWKNIFDKWLPASEYKFDEKRYDFEYYDLRDHAWENNGMEQMDIYIPVQKR